VLVPKNNHYDDMGLVIVMANQVLSLKIISTQRSEIKK